MINHKNRQFIIFYILAIITCIGTPACSSRRPVWCEVPLHYINGVPVIEVMINGQGPFNFIVDTGANLSLILVRPGLIEQLKLRGDVASGPATIHSQLEQDPLTLPIYGPAAISIGHLSISNVGFIESPDESFNRNAFKNGVDGLIGTGIFSNKNLVIVFDFIEQEFRVGREANQLGLASNEKVETVFLTTEFPSSGMGVQINAGGLDMPAMLDTGSVFGLGLPMIYRKQLSIPTEETPDASSTIGGKMAVIKSTLNGDLIIGHHTSSNPTVRFKNTGNLYANIGFEILKEFRIIGFDYARNQIYLGGRKDSPALLRPSRSKQP